MRNHNALAPHDRLEELITAAKSAKDPLFKTRLRAIVLCKRGETPQSIAETLLVSDRAVRNWIVWYNAGGSTRLIPKPTGRQGGNPKWDTTIWGALTKEIDKGGRYWSVPLMQEWIKETYKKEIPENTVWYHVRDLHYSFKSARPHPYQGNREAQAVFKKGALHKSSPNSARKA